MYRTSLIVLLLVIATTLVGVANANKEALDWLVVKQSIRVRFPKVEQLSTAELDQELYNPKAVHPILLDTRTPEEYAVSHLQGAKLATTKQQALEQLQGVSKDYPIVIYCSVGYRSSALAEQLQVEGYKNVANLEGSIFAWANEGRPVYQNDQLVKKVHSFNQKWGQLLDRNLWSNSP